jgi:hypothetical protein
MWYIILREEHDYKCLERITEEIVLGDHFEILHNEGLCDSYVQYSGRVDMLS